LTRISRNALIGFALIATSAGGFVSGFYLYNRVQETRKDVSAEVGSEMTVDELTAFDGFPLYWLGQEFEGLGLNKIFHRVATHPGGGQAIGDIESVTLVYGDCQPNLVDRSCPAPVQVTILSRCTPPLGESVIRDTFTLRGAPATRTFDGHLHVDAGGSRIIVISSLGSVGEQDDQAARAVEALVAANPAPESASPVAELTPDVESPLVAESAAGSSC
jgi:hypothetical protein